MNKSALAPTCAVNIHTGALAHTSGVCNALHGLTPKVSDFSSEAFLTTSVKYFSLPPPVPVFLNSILLSTYDISKPGYLGPLLMSVS